MGLMGPPGLWLRVLASWAVDEAGQCGGWIVWQILGRPNPTNCVKPYQGKMVDFGGYFRPFGVLMGAPGVTAGGLGLLCLG